MTAKNLRLVIFEECNRSCEGCCNKDFNIPSYPQVESFAGYKKIILTGGEPMLKPELVVDTCKRIRQETDAPIVMYTAKSKRVFDLISMLHILDGVTLTLHEPYDVKPFSELSTLMRDLNITGKTLRLNVFSNVDITDVDTSGWSVKDNIEWIKDCPLPNSEVLMRL